MLESLINNKVTVIALLCEPTLKFIFSFGSIYEQKTEFEKYLSIDSDPILWWKEKQNDLYSLAILTKVFLCIPASSIAGERVFSKAGYLMSQGRTSLSAKSVDSFLFISCNYKYC